MRVWPSGVPANRVGEQGLRSDVRDSFFAVNRRRLHRQRGPLRIVATVCPRRARSWTSRASITEACRLVSFRHSAR